MEGAPGHTGRVSGLVQLRIAHWRLVPILSAAALNGLEVDLARATFSASQSFADAAQLRGKTLWTETGQGLGGDPAGMPTLRTAT